MRLLNPTRMPGIVLVVLTSALGSLAAGCGGGDDDTTALSADRIAAFESPYCVTARTWAVHELGGDGDDKAADPARSRRTGESTSTTGRRRSSSHRRASETRTRSSWISCASG